MDITLDTAKAIYRRAIDSTASDREGVAWWSTVAAELVDVICAESVAAAAAVIAWWHHDWSEVGDTPKAAAGRIRRAARELTVRTAPAKAVDDVKHLFGAGPKCPTPG
ncbi:hypothetical protein [Burkholderia vietnamiensis]|uniref:hypothetical protein n=1 Tax=Burkholderia vietnamiensis TaxID=60552 RepID=UPI001FCA2C97|nr:hypothetical protein [Burkholderia vietnamiensis]